MSILVRGRFDIAHGRKLACIRRGEEVGQIVLVVCRTVVADLVHRRWRRVRWIGGLREVLERLVVRDVIRDRGSADVPVCGAAHGAAVSVRSGGAEATLE